MNNTTKIILIIIILVLLASLTLINGSNTIKVSNTIHHDNLSNTMKDIISKFELEIEHLYIVDKNMDGFTIFIDKNNQEVFEIMLELININKLSETNNEIIDIQYNSNTYTFRKSERGKSQSNNLLHLNRITIKDYLDFLSTLNIESIFKDYENSNTDYYEIAADGYLRQIDYTNLNLDYHYYKYSDGHLINLNDDDLKEIDKNKYYLPVFLGVGEIHDREDHTIYKNNKVVVILIENY